MMFDTFLMDGTTIDKNKMRVTRVMNIDEKNIKLISREAIDVFLDYERETQRLFTIYDSENLK